MLPDNLLLVFKVLVTAALVVASSLTAERLRPAWGGIVASIPVSAGASFIMLAIDQPAGFVASAALGAVVAGIAAFGYVTLFVRLAPHRSAATSVGSSLLLWIALNLVCHAIVWTGPAAMAADVAVFFLSNRLMRGLPPSQGTPAPTLPTILDLALRGLAVGVLATFVSVSARLFGPATAGTLAAFPIVFLTVSFIVHRRLGGVAAAAMMAAAAPPLLGVITAFLVIHLLAPVAGSANALLAALAVSIAWPVVLAARQLRIRKVALA